MRIPAELVDLLVRFFDVAHERGVLNREQSVFELRMAAGRAAADAVCVVVEHDLEATALDVVECFNARFPGEALSDEVIAPEQVEPIRALLEEMAGRLPQ